MEFAKFVQAILFLMVARALMELEIATLLIKYGMVSNVFV